MQPLIALASIAQSVVLIVNITQGAAKTGTGFVVSSTKTASRILTANHVIEGATGPLVFIGGPHGDHYQATIINADPLRDIALLEISNGGMPPVTMAPASPSTGTDVQVLGFPTMAIGASPAPNASASPLPLMRLAMATATGKADGQAEDGEDVLLDLPLTHGDSGGPVVDTKSNQVVGLVLGLGAGYGVAQWMTGDGLGLSVAAIDAFLAQSQSTNAPPKPSYFVTLASSAQKPISNSWPQLAASAGFIQASDPEAHDRCRDATGAPIADAYIIEDFDGSVVSMEVRDCSGALYYGDEMASDADGVKNTMRLMHRSFLGYIDTHRAEWTALLKYGVAVDPAANPYLALMSVGRNPFGQLSVRHVLRGGPADIAGLRPDDAILKIDGRPTRALADPFIARLLNQPTVTLLIDRDEREFSVRLQLRRFAELTKDGPVNR